ncbi:MAG: zinc-dependent metalloprotease [Candidatus Aminicenantaceae bacterium]
MRKITVLVLGLCFCLSLSLGQPPTIQSKVSGMRAYSGYFPFYWDALTGRILLEIDKLDQEFLYVNSQPAGLGSNDIGLDRSQLGRSRVVKFLRVGPKVLLMQPNYAYRADSDDPDERKAVRDAFAQSVIWGFKVEAEEEGRVLVDLTPFLMRDAHGAADRIRRSRQGNFRLDVSRSAVYLANTRNFPKNTELEALLTFTAGDAGNFVRQVAPDPSSITLRQHHSLVELPGPGYEPRIWDPRSMFSSRSGYMDFAAPIDQSLQKKLIARHRLQKKDPNARISDPVEPIVYYIDRAAPEPIRSALLEGARWWNQAFEAIGYRNAFQVKVLPEGADPMDVRYNMVNWVHRSTRGWSYGGSVTDPRTGEIIKGHVALGSQRIRQDFLIASGLAGEYDGSPDATRAAVELGLARIRQLSAHEVGHTLGVGHNYASSVNDRASVMDYPHPRVKITAAGQLDLSDAYDVGIGAWDKVCVAYGYQDFPDGVDEEAELKTILDNAFTGGLLYLTNQDAAPAGGAHPLSNDWDNGTDPVDELIHKMKVRAIALTNFSEKKVPLGAPMAELEEVLVPVYLFCRYQIEAAASVIGGLYYGHTIRGGAQENPSFVPAQEQHRALEELLRTLAPENLAVPEHILSILPPRAPDLRQSRELFPGYTGITFDPLGAAETLAGITVANLLHPERAARLIQYHAREPELPDFHEVLDRMVEFTWNAPKKDGLHGELQRVVDNVVLYQLMGLAVYDGAAPQVRAVARWKIKELEVSLGKRVDAAKSPNEKAHILSALDLIEQFLKDPSQLKLPQPLSAPPGAPIGN